jgi:hypothetical protein
MDTTLAAPDNALPRRPLRSAGAVLGGFVTVFVLSSVTDAVLHATGVYPPAGRTMSAGLFVLAIAYRTVFTVLGGFLTARLAPARPVRHAVVLGMVGTLAALVGVLAFWNRGPEFGPHWYPIALVVLALPSTWLGGQLRAGAAGR